MPFWKRFGLLKRSRSEDSEKTATYVLQSDLGSKIPMVESGKLLSLIGDLERYSNEDPRHTLIRHLAGELRGDLYETYGEALDSRLSLINNSCEYLLAFDYPKSLWQRVSSQDLQIFMAERVRYWVSSFAGTLADRALAVGDEETASILRPREA